MSKETMGKSKGKSKGNKGAKGSHKSKTSKIGLSGLENSKSEASWDTQESAQTYTTDTSWIHDGWSLDEWNDGWSFDEWSGDWSSVGWHEGWEQTNDTSASSFSLGGLDLGATSSPKWFEWAKMNQDTGSAVNTFPSNFGPEGARDGRFYRTESGEWVPDDGAWQSRWKRFAQISEWKTHWCTQSVVQRCRDRVQRTTRFLPWTWRWLHDSESQQNWSGNENSFREIGELAWKERTHSSQSWEVRSQFLPEPRSEVWRNPQRERRRAVSWEGESTVGKRVWQSSALVSPTKTLNRDVAPIGDDIEPIGGISCRCRNGKWWRRRTSGSRNSQSQNESEESHEQRETRTWRFRTCCLQELVCCLCRRSRCWWTTSNWTVGGRGKRKNNSDCSFRLRFLDTGKRRHVSNSDLSRQQVWSNGSDVLWTERSHSMLHFISCWFHQRSWFSQNHFEMR